MTEIKNKEIKIEPTFKYVDSCHKKLYELEGKAVMAIKAVALYREKTYNEDRWKCAVPEAIFALLLLYDPDSVTKAVEQFKKSKGLSRLEYILKFGSMANYGGKNGL